MRILEYGKDDLSAVFKRQTTDYSGAFDKVKTIISDVEKEGDDALKKYTLMFDKQDVKSAKISEKEIDAAVKRLDKKVFAALKAAHKNIAKLHKTQYSKVALKWMCEVEKGVSVGEKATPLDSVGCYVPGGRASYPSSVLMTVTPAKIAGVKRVVVVSPPPVSDAVLAACRIAGADELYQVGGAQAVAALAYGTKTIKGVSKIVGPGNKYVTAAKMLVYGRVDIDMPAGPSEVLIIADKTANPYFIASDILAQSEHDPNAQSVLVSNDKKILSTVRTIVDVKMRTSQRRELLEESSKNITFIKSKNEIESVKIANQYAPEHLELHTQNPDKVAEGIINAGAIFVGGYSPVAAGDYASGGNHVLPTGGAARFSPQLSVRDYLKTSNVQKLTKQGLKNLSSTIISLAEAEGLMEHAQSIRERFENC